MSLRWLHWSSLSTCCRPIARLPVNQLLERFAIHSSCKRRRDCHHSSEFGEQNRSDADASWGNARWSRCGDCDAAVGCLEHRCARWIVTSVRSLPVSVRLPQGRAFGQRLGHVTVSWASGRCRRLAASPRFVIDGAGRAAQRRTVRHGPASRRREPHCTQRAQIRLVCCACATAVSTSVSRFCARCSPPSEAGVAVGTPATTHSDNRRGSQRQVETVEYGAMKAQRHRGTALSLRSWCTRNARDPPSVDCGGLP